MEEIKNHPLYRIHNLDSVMSTMWEFYKKRFVVLIIASFIMSLCIQLLSLTFDFKELTSITDPMEMLEKVKEMQAGKVEKPSLVLLDLILPDINGSEILNAIKKNEATKDILVFVLSNYADKNPDPDRAKPDKFILKTDIAPTELANLVKKVLK